VKELRNAYAFVAIGSILASPLTGESLGEIGLWGVDWSPANRVSVAGESVFTPSPSGYHWWGDSGDDAGCPLPKFSTPRVFADGWAYGKISSRDPFKPCTGYLDQMSFWIFPKPSTSGRLRSSRVNQSIFESWIRHASNSAKSEAISDLVLASIAKWTHADPSKSSVINHAGGDNAGYPFVAGNLRLVFPGRPPEVYLFATAVSAVGSTWAMCVVAERRSEDGKSDVSSKALELAKAIFYLNKDHRGAKNAPLDPLGPWGWRGRRGGEED
jgi:hypothetical protein